MKKIIACLLFMFVCVGLVGCGKDYGIYTESGYDMAESKEERLDIEMSFYKLSQYVRDIKRKSYFDEALAPQFHETEYTWSTIYCELETMYNCLIGKGWSGYSVYMDAYDRLSKYVKEENMDSLYLTQDEFYEYFDYIHGTAISK